MADDGYSAETAFDWPTGQTRVTGNTATRGPGVPAFGVDWWKVRLRAGRAYRIQMRRPSFGPEGGGYRYLSMYANLVNAQGGSHSYRDYRYGDDGTYFPSISFTPSGAAVQDWWLKVDDGNNGFNGYRGEYTLEIVPAPAPKPSTFAAGPGARHEIGRSAGAALLFPQVTPGGITTGVRQTPWDYSWNSVCWSPEHGLFVAVQNNTSNNNVMTSPDGIAWTGRSTGGSARFNAVAWSPALRMFVAFDCYYNYYVYTSPDGITWSPYSVTSYGYYTSAICWSPERGIFVAILGSNNAYALTSDNATVWTTRSLPAQNSWQSVCWSPERGLFVAVGQSGSGNRVMTSPDGIAWTLRPSASDLAWRGVCWSPPNGKMDGLFVAVASSGTGSRVMTSPDGLAWTLRQTPVDNNWRSVCWSEELGLFMAVAESGTGNRAMTSPDGINWTPFSTPADNNWQSVAWSPQRMTFAAVASSGSGNRAFSVTHTPRVDEGFHAIHREGMADTEWNARVRCFAPVKPLGIRGLRAIGREAARTAIHRPRHGVGRPAEAALLYPKTVPASMAAATRSTPWDYSWNSVCWSPELELFVAVQNNNSSNNVMTSPDGIAWTGRNIGSGRFHAVAWSPALRRFVIFDTYKNYYVYTSADGIGWSAASVNTAGLYVTAICWSPEHGIFAAIPGSSTSTALTSDNATAWTARTLPAQNSWQSVCWAPQVGGTGLFVAVGQSGSGNRVMTSPDGIVWTLRPSAADLSWRGVCWSPPNGKMDGLFVAVASSGSGNRVMTSPDGMAWTLHPTPADNSWRSVCWASEARLFFAVAESGSGNRAMTSPDGMNWTLLPTPADNNWQSVCWAPERRAFVAVANSGSGNRVFTAIHTPRIEQGFHRIAGIERALHTEGHRLEVGGAATSHAARWRIVDGVFTTYAASRHSILYPKRHRLFARDVAGGNVRDLGVAEENPDAPNGNATFTLADVPLPDGVYEVEARSTDALWADARSRNVSTFRLRSGEEPAPELPAVVNLRAAMTADWWRVLTWSVAGEPGDEAFAFGVWFGEEIPVGISGPPDAILPRIRGLEHYEHYFRQTAPRWVAVAAFAGDARGQPAEAFLSWDADAPEAPAGEEGAGAGAEPAVPPTPEPTQGPGKKTKLYYNTKGGRYYHMDANCPSTDKKYLPLKGTFTYGNIGKSPYDKLQPCGRCNAPNRP